jgi:hypothetical protein
MSLELTETESYNSRRIKLIEIKGGKEIKNSVIA